MTKLQYTMTNLQKNPLLLQNNGSYLTIIGDPFKIEGSRPYVIAQCRCGVIKLFQWEMVKSGHSKSCGCFNREITSLRGRTHGWSNTPLYNTWCGMKARCYNKKNPSYFRYGGAGIIMCDEWKGSFISFKEWAISAGWVQGLQVDRIDNLKGYNPSNCRIVTAKQNCRNKTNNIQITYQGKTMILIEWAEYLNMGYSKLNLRYDRGLRGDDLFSEKDYGNYTGNKKGHYKPRRAVNQLLNGKIIATYSGTIEASQLSGVRYRYILQVLSGHLKTAKGYEWEYAT